MRSARITRSRSPAKCPKCKNEVAMLRAPAGVCETCDLIRVAGTQEANETRPRFFMPMVHHAEPVRHLAPMKPLEEPAAPPASSQNGDGAQPPICARYKKGPERGKCSTCGHTRAEHLAAKKSAAPAAPKRRGVGAAMTIEQLRSQWERRACGFASTGCGARVEAGGSG
jgi:hypothetical protein